MAQPPRAGTDPSGFKTRPADHRFFAAMAILAALVSLTGFGWTYGPKVVAGASSVPTVIHVHAAVFATWLALAVAQSLLASSGRLRTHQRLGVAGAVLAGLMLVLGVAAAITVARLGHRGLPGAEFARPDGFLLFSLFAILAFATLAGAALVLRRKPQAHKRLMLVATVGALLPPGISRLPWVGSHLALVTALAVAFFLAGPAYDLITRKRVHAAYLWGGLPVVPTLPPLVELLSATETWQRIAAWLMH